MARNNDPLIESLMQLAVAAAPLVKKARESGIFRTETVVEAEIVNPAPPKAAEPPPPPEPPKAPEPPAPETAALQDIIVRQALRISELEAEVAALKAAAKKAPAKAKPKAKAKPGSGPAKA